ncbi:MAG: CHAP domain-containing protein [Treponema sp.]|nr:CHAP domain-containing protein [Treponema sp.]
MEQPQVNKEWFDKTVPYPVPDLHKLQGQCVQFIRWLLEIMGLPNWGLVAGAADFWELYERDLSMNQYWDKLPNTPDFLPQEGDIYIWNKHKGNGYGHIGIVFGNDHTLRYFHSIESNWKPLVVTVVQHNYNDVFGFFRLKSLEEKESD